MKKKKLYTFINTISDDELNLINMEGPLSSRDISLDNKFGRNCNIFNSNQSFNSSQNSGVSNGSNSDISLAGQNNISTYTSIDDKKDDAENEQGAFCSSHFSQ